MRVLDKSFSILPGTDLTSAQPSNRKRSVRCGVIALLVPVRSLGIQCQSGTYDRGDGIVKKARFFPKSSGILPEVKLKFANF